MPFIIIIWIPFDEVLNTRLSVSESLLLLALLPMVTVSVLIYHSIT